MIRSCYSRQKLRERYVGKASLLIETKQKGKLGGAGGIRTHEWRFCRPLSSHFMEPRYWLFHVSMPILCPFEGIIGHRRKRCKKARFELAASGGTSRSAKMSPKTASLSVFGDIFAEDRKSTRLNSSHT